MTLNIKTEALAEGGCGVDYDALLRRANFEFEKNVMLHITFHMSLRTKIPELGVESRASAKILNSRCNNQSSGGKRNFSKEGSGGGGGGGGYCPNLSPQDYMKKKAPVISQLIINSQ